MNSILSDVTVYNIASFVFSDNPTFFLDVRDIFFPGSIF